MTEQENGSNIVLSKCFTTVQMASIAPHYVGHLCYYKLILAISVKISLLVSIYFAIWQKRLL